MFFAMRIDQKDYITLFNFLSFVAGWFVAEVLDAVQMQLGLGSDLRITSKGGFWDLQLLTKKSQSLWWLMHRVGYQS